MKTLLAFSLAAMLSLVASPVPAHEPAAPTAIGTWAIDMDATVFEGLPRREVSAGSHGDKPSRWQGVALADVLRNAGVPMDKALRGAHLAKYVRITASDGYQVVFGLAELDADFGKAEVLLVDRHEDQPLTKEDGPYRLVVPGDARAGRWVRNVVRIEVLDAATTSRSGAPAKH
ncbi:molybdopterin-dependent oxidoreductase [Arenimonas sp.]|uniref:molybdopterin-dependent oxidoreductase n=1 Tax=Arenimonas sp. TaxID=1872635 RepID=UPI0039E35AA7